MIAFLKGKLVEAQPSYAVVDVQGVGYEVLIPVSSFDKLPPPGQEVTILTHLAIREDAHVLYGFMSVAERDMFRLLIHTVSGIGPKTAKLIVVSLAGKLAVVPRGSAATPRATQSVEESVLIALVGLGWNERAAGQALDEAMAGATEAEREAVPALLRLHHRVRHAHL